MRVDRKCDGHTDRQTDTQTGKYIFCPCIALDRQQSQNFYTPPVFSAPAAGDPVGISWRCLMLIKLEWLGYRMVKKNYDDMLSRFHLIPERHGQTDRRTDIIVKSISRVSVLMRDNKKLSCRRETARSFLSLNILLSYSRSLISFETTLMSRACVSPY